MTQHHPFEFMSSSFKKMMHNREEALASHRKHIEALGEAQKKATDVMKNITQLQQQYMKQAFENLSSMMKEFMAQPHNQETWQKGADSVKEHFTRSLEHGNTVATMLSKSHKDIYETMKNSIAESAEKAKKSTSHRSKH